ncbi:MULTISPECIES: hypothetical protein [Methanothermobacter]|uniref:Uncharacterized protein n=1 Tax=Methanothermobacter marburgensis (strain ATCC BAA-927 / DSM 2133 / JCM 14651 / NBRC 100331 / OCM 82 / Marburg) TaxID=79929 RepID=D9PWJ9_METTM|nr:MULTISPECIES: hypothetical protein [Methanothermobacter]ADL58597.1 conserved hypothetical protein [Methanothermobacter marburgensis str. Marburg]QEF95175.1 hypothetical protein FVF72_08455 [Methanothermobacter sp. KEPCO-1]QHN08177.1 hypothetical protein FZP68_05170 [Methanothermobacter sp. THM-2]WBF09184.1 hypothetical protein ISG34_04955 [Methanothermobacter marburgensis]
MELEEKIRELESEIKEKDGRIRELELKLAECLGRVDELRSEKSELQEEVNRLHVMKLDLKLRNLQELEDENNRLKHRIEITKGLLDDARERLEVLEGVVDEFLKQGLTGRLRGREPEGLIYYRKRFGD